MLIDDYRRRICERLPEAEHIQFRKVSLPGSTPQVGQCHANVDGWKEHDRLSMEMKAIGAALSAIGAAYGKRTALRSRMSAAGRARIAAAQRARWAKVKARSGKASVVTLPTKRTMSASARKRIAAAQRARWAKVKAAKKSA